MIERLGRKKYNIYAMDVESHNDDESIAKQETSIWLGAFINEESAIDDERSYFYTIEQWLERLKDLTTPHYEKNRKRLVKNVCCYIYNASFEWSFVLPVLLKSGFTFSETITPESEYVYNSVTTKTCSSVWLVNLKFGKNNGQVVLKDLAKIYGGGLASVAKSFGLPTQKGEIDYKLNRLHGHIPTKEEKEYVFKDCRIIIDILLEMQKRKDSFFFSSASMATYSMKNLLKFGYPRHYRPYKKFRHDYPHLDKEETEFIRQAVEGGITYAPQAWQFKNINVKLGHIDMHQAHPSSAYLNRFPCGKGVYFTGKPPIDKISCVRCRISYTGVKLHSVIKLIGLNFVTDYEIYLWTPEIPTMFKCYNHFKIEFIDGYAYNTRLLPWREYYNHNFQKRLEAKAKDDKFNILYYKLLNNSSYGKFLEKGHNEVYENCIDELGSINSIVHEKDKEELESKYTYVPVGALIPAYSRVRLIETALKLGWENVTYFDTDSIFFVWNEQTAAAWSRINQENALGGWGWEEFIDRAQFAAPKRYKTETDGVTTVKAGGINFKKFLEDSGKKSLDFEETNIISSEWEVQRAYRVKGGTLIEFQKKEMRVPEKYRAIYEHNSIT